MKKTSIVLIFVVIMGTLCYSEISENMLLGNWKMEDRNFIRTLVFMKQNKTRIQVFTKATGNELIVSGEYKIENNSVIFKMNFRGKIGTVQFDILRLTAEELLIVDKRDIKFLYKKIN